jgi:hypothetical protein
LYDAPSDSAACRTTPLARAPVWSDCAFVGALVAPGTITGSQYEH